MLHCFTSQPRTGATRPSRIGGYVSFSGILTYKTAEDLRATAAALPLDRIIVETDSPYLAPVPYRGKSNEPAFVVKTLETLAEVKGLSRRGDGPHHQRQFLPPVLQGAAPAALWPGGMTTASPSSAAAHPAGVPRIGNDWGKCDPANPKNRRRRCSALITRTGPTGQTRVLIDTSPDLREQMLSAGVGDIDAVLYHP